MVCDCNRAITRILEPIQAAADFALAPLKILCKKVSSQGQHVREVRQLAPHEKSMHPKQHIQSAPWDSWDE